ncbi:MAG TPA: hypothetical protein VN670_09895 [Acidobacteriaceae bacterium]|nr:hypothetical protein [Acidobacteriaceae bacterium]
MATLTIRQFDEKSKMKLRVRAAHNGRSMEEEAREILRASLNERKSPPESLAKAIRRRFAPFGGVHIEIPKREPIRQSTDFSA